VSGANNTRVHWSGEDAISFRYHATDVVTLHRDGTRQLRTNGWDTLTTKQRIHEFGSRHVVGKIETSRASADQWYIRAEHDEKDPHPLGDGYHHRGERAWRTIPKPFIMPDPGPEPVDDGEGCIVGREEFVPYEELGYDFGVRRIPSHLHRYKVGDSIRYECAGVEHIRWGKERYNHSTWTLPDGETVRFAGTYKQCPHCAAFQAKHEAWEAAKNGDRWGRNSERGYSQMCEWLDRFETREAWHAAYIEELRECRKLNEQAREWDTRNWLEFYDGITVTPQGYVPLKVKRANDRELVKLARAEARRQRVHAKRQALLDKQERKRCEERRVRRMIAEALANDLVSAISDKRSEYPDWSKR
jgi:hypothetical protein